MRYPGDDPHLTRHERVSMVDWLEYLDGQLGQLAGCWTTGMSRGPQQWS
jgi:hypothetical protein